MSIGEQILEREITEILHFTTNRGLVGILAQRNLLSRPLLREEDYLKYILHFNAETRPEEAAYFDKTADWIRFVNLSISEINKRFLDVSRRWHTEEDVWWAILAFDPEIMTHENVWFTTTNNGYDAVVRGQGDVGFSNLFANSIPRKANGYNGPWSCRRLFRESRLPTCEQAEVLYPDKIDLKHLKKVYVENETQYDLAKGWANEFSFSEVCVEINAEKFSGRPN